MTTHIKMSLEDEMRLIDKSHVNLFNYTAEGLALCFTNGIPEVEEIYGLTLRVQRGLIRDYAKTTCTEFQREFISHLDEDILKILMW